MVTKITDEAAAAAIADARAKGQTVTNAPARETRVAGNLPKGEYLPARDVQAQHEMPARTAGGQKWQALSFTCNGRPYEIGVSGLFQKVRVLVDPKGAKTGDKWQGEAAEPTEEVWRFGKKVAFCDRKDTSDGAVYAAPAFTLTRTIIEVVPEYVDNGDGRRTRIFNAGNSLREISIVSPEDAADA